MRILANCYRSSLIFSCYSNTCYLNSSIQCLSHTPILREYFTSKAYYKDVNRTNPLGHEGRLAQVSAVLINELWKRSNQPTLHQPKRVTAPGLYSPLTNAPALTPKTFKESLGKFNDIFAGNEQHDAQELLAFLLGGLSEDLNRIVEKPYMEAPDSDGRPDSELADIWWSNHLKREMSIIVALFTGQYKSLLTCRSCKYESARFEPFTFLQLPLPEDEHLSVSLTFYSAKEGACPMKYCVRVRNDGALRDVLVALAKILHQDEIEERGDETFDVQEANLSAGESKDDADDIHIRRARNMTVVVMREGYIARMAAVSQNQFDSFHQWLNLC
jgi:Ubiquitin carboxyl-terminal hydrolase